MENSTDNKNIKVDNKKKIDNTHDDLSNSMASVGQLSEMHHQRTAVNLKGLQKTYNYLRPLWPWFFSDLSIHFLSESSLVYFHLQKTLFQVV